MSSNSNSPSFRAQVFNLNTGTFSIKQVPLSQTVFPCKKVSELTPIQISRLTKAYYKVGYVLNANLADWLRDFTYEFQPEQEILIWEDIAAVFEKYNKTSRLTFAQKREVLKRLIKLVEGETPEDSASRELLTLLSQEQAAKFCIRPYKPLPPSKLDYRMLAQAYQEYEKRHQVKIHSDKWHDLLIALTHLMEGKQPSSDIGKELLAIWKELELSQESVEQDFNPDEIQDERQKNSRAVVIRPGQKKFKRQLMEAYTGCCSITGCPVESVLEAAHIIPYLGSKTDHPSNGLLLRVDIHKLFDAHYLSINPKTNRVEIAVSLKNTCYCELAGNPLRLPLSKTARPNQQALLKHYQTFCSL